MALILKTGKKINDPHNGAISTAYVNTKVLGGLNVKKGESVRVDFYCHRDEASKTKSPIMQQNITVPWGDFDTIINAVIDDLQERDTIWSLLVRRIYNYITTLTYIDTNGDEQPIEFFGIPITDWKSDEV